MANRLNLADAKVVRLNAQLHPAGAYELSLFERYGLRPLLVEPTTPAEIVSLVSDCDALFAVSVSLPTQVVESLSRCRVISRLGTGTDKIDVATATRMGILVTNVPYFCVEEQADHTMAMLLALVRKLPQTYRYMTQGAWSKARAAMTTNQRLEGRVLGLVGFGNSAQAVARRARGFGLRVIATRRNLDAARAAAAALDVTLVDLETVIRESDYLSLHLPLAAETYHLIDRAALARMKPTAFLINTSRGALVDELALAAALQEGRLAGAGIDTFEHINPFVPDGAPPDHPLMALENVVLTPHVAAGSVQAMEDVARGGVENVLAILSGHWPNPENIVNPGVVPRVPLADYTEAILRR